MLWLFFITAMEKKRINNKLEKSKLSNKAEIKERKIKGNGNHNTDRGLRRRV